MSGELRAEQVERDVIRLTWHQIVWGLGIIVAIMGSWFQLNARLDRLTIAVNGIYTKWEIDAMKADASRVHADLERRIETLEKRGR